LLEKCTSDIEKLKEGYCLLFKIEGIKRYETLIIYYNKVSRDTLLQKLVRKIIMRETAYKAIII